MHEGSNVLLRSLILLACVTIAVADAAETVGSFPRLFGMNIGGPKYYDDPDKQLAFSKHDILILGFYRGWEQDGKGSRSMRAAVTGIKALNPDILIGQYTILGETQDSLGSPNRLKAAKVTRSDWWLVDGKKNRIQWSKAYGAWDINISKWVRPDKNGMRYPEWLAEYDDATFFKQVPEFDIWYLDNALSQPAAKMADWDLDGINDSRDDPRIARAYRQANVSYWQKARALRPNLILIGNAPDLSSAEYVGQLQGDFLEALIGLSWSIEAREGWSAAMNRYRAAIRDTAAPNIVGFNVHGRLDDYQRMRYGLASSLLEDGYFSYTELNSKYRTVAWFDEFDIDLGKPKDPPARTPWKKGVYRRNFEKGAVLVNPGPKAQVVILESGYRRLSGKQDPATNNGQLITSVKLAAKDGLIVLKLGS